MAICTAFWFAWILYALKGTKGITAATTLPPDGDVSALDGELPLRQCSAKLDLVFLVDQSRSITDEDYANQVGFIEDLTSQLDIGNGVRVSFVRYAHAAQTEFCFGEYLTKEDLAEELSTLKKTWVGSTKTYRALSFVKKRVLTGVCGVREGVRRIVMVMTDGRDNRLDYTIKAAAKLKEAGAEIVSVGFGSEVDWESLEQWSRPVDMGDLEGALEAMCEATTTPYPTITTTKTASTTTTTTAAPCSSPVDLVVMVDQSRSLSSEEFDQELEFVRDLTSRLTIGPANVQVSVVQFAHAAQTQFCLNEHENNDELAEALSKLKITFRGSTKTYRALRWVRSRVLKEKCGRREGVKAVVLLMTDGRDNTPEYTRSEAAKLHSMGVRVVPVGFGGVIDQSELALWASDDVTSVMGLDDVMGIMGQVCSE